MTEPVAREWIMELSPFVDRTCAQCFTVQQGKWIGSGSANRRARAEVRNSVLGDGLMRSMHARPAHLVLIMAAALLYAVGALSLPYLSIDHDAAVQVGDPSHSNGDVHDWLKWATGSSLVGGKPVYFVAQPCVGSTRRPAAQAQFLLLSATSHSRAPPAA
jgi:hypothetical protein